MFVFSFLAIAADSARVFNSLLYENFVLFVMFFQIHLSDGLLLEIRFIYISHSVFFFFFFLTI